MNGISTFGSISSMIVRSWLSSSPIIWSWNNSVTQVTMRDKSQSKIPFPVIVIWMSLSEKKRKLCY